MKNNKIYMACGHVANAEQHINDNVKIPYCAICDCNIIKMEKPNLDGRVAECIYCNNTSPSSFDLPFFEYKEKSTNDRYYCGCRGWD